MLSHTHNSCQAAKLLVSLCVLHCITQLHYVGIYKNFYQLITTAFLHAVLSNCY